VDALAHELLYPFFIVSGRFYFDLGFRLGEYAAAIFIWTLGEIAMASTTPALISRIAPPGQQGVYQGSYSMSWSPSMSFWLDRCSPYRHPGWLPLIHC
jgi:hypothetical protein